MSAGGGSEPESRCEMMGGEQNTHKQPQDNHKTKMAVQETASQLSMALKVQEYPTLKVNRKEACIFCLSRDYEISGPHSTVGSVRKM